MVIILEGVNKVGKTTVADMLKTIGFMTYYNRQLLTFENTHSAKWHTKGQIDAITQMLNLMHESEVNIDFVLDRFHLSEMVYGKLDRKYAATYLKAVDERLAKIGAKLIYMVDDIESVNQRTGKDMYSYCVAFDQAFIESKMDKTMYNLKNPISELLKWIGSSKFKQMKLFEE